MSRKMARIRLVLTAGAALALALAAPAVGAQGARPDPGPGQTGPPGKAGEPDREGADRAQRPGPAGQEGRAGGPSAGRTGPAQDVTPSCARNYERFDDDDDGAVSRAEFVRVPSASGDPEEVFVARDADRDGSLTKGEFCSGWAAWQAQPAMHGRMGGMGPGAMGKPGQMGHGQMGHGQMGHGQMGHGQMGHGQMGRMGTGPGQSGQMGPGMGGAGATGAGCETHFSYFDIDEDGVVSDTEFLQAPQVFGNSQALFRMRDQNRDEQLTRSEFCADWDTAWSGGARGATQATAGGPLQPDSDCQAHFRAFDADRNGRVTPDELATWPRLGAPSTGATAAKSLTRDEFCEAWQEWTPGDSGQGQGQGAGQGQDDEGQGGLKTRKDPGSERQR